MPATRRTASMSPQLSALPCKLQILFVGWTYPAGVLAHHPTSDHCTRPTNCSFHGRLLKQLNRCERVACLRPFAKRLKRPLLPRKTAATQQMQKSRSEGYRKQRQADYIATAQAWLRRGRRTQVIFHVAPQTRTDSPECWQPRPSAAPKCRHQNDRKWIHVLPSAEQTSFARATGTFARLGILAPHARTPLDPPVRKIDSLQCWSTRRSR